MNNLNSFLLIMFFFLLHLHSFSFLNLISLKCTSYTSSLQWTRGHQCVSHKHTSQTSPTHSAQAATCATTPEIITIIIIKKETFTHKRCTNNGPMTGGGREQQKVQINEKCWSEAWGTGSGEKWSAEVTTSGLDWCASDCARNRWPPRVVWKPQHTLSHRCVSVLIFKLQKRNSWLM